MELRIHLVNSGGCAECVKGGLDESSGENKSRFRLNSPSGMCALCVLELKILYGSLEKYGVGKWMFAIIREVLSTDGNRFYVQLLL